MFYLISNTRAITVYRKTKKQTEFHQKTSSIEEKLK
jgi:hypothetical protein